VKLRKVVFFNIASDFFGLTQNYIEN